MVLRMKDIVSFKATAAEIGEHPADRSRI